MILRHILLCTVIVLTSNCQGQDYGFLNPDSYNNNDNEYLLHIPNHSLNEDLQTSDIPINLQGTLPQYNLNNEAINLNLNKANIIPSTHRPNYSHLFRNGRFTNINRDLFLNEENNLKKYVPYDDKSNTDTNLNQISKQNIPNENHFSEIGDKLSNQNNKLENEPNHSNETEYSSSEEDDYDDYSDSEEYDDVTTEETDNSDEYDTDEDSKSVVSVVTTKSVINNTIIPTILPNTVVYKENINSNEDVTTDNWIVLGSIQTSKSISETRFSELNNVHTENDDDGDDVETTTNINDESITETTVNTKLKSSTESLIDKLDRVQSDLSSGLLTGAFKDNNNITIIDESLTNNKQKDKKLDVALNTTSTKHKLTSEDIVKNFKKTNNILANRNRLDSDVSENTTKQPQKKKIVLPNINSLSRRKHTTARTTRKPKTTTTTASPVIVNNILKNAAPVDISSYLPKDFKLEKDNKNTSTGVSNLFESVKLDNISQFLPPGYKLTTESSKIKETTTVAPETSTVSKRFENLFKESKIDDISALLPPGFKLTTTTEASKSKTSTSVPDISNLLNKSKSDDISKFLPPGYKLKVTTEASTTKVMTSTVASKVANLFKDSISDNISAFLPPGYKLKNTTESTTKIPKIVTKVDDISAFLPPGYKLRTTTEAAPKSTSPSKVSNLFKESKVDDISAFLPPGYKLRSTTEAAPKSTAPSKISNLFKESKVDDISAFLPPGYKLRTPISTTTEATSSHKDLISEIKSDDISKTKSETVAADTSTQSSLQSTTEKPSNSFKVVFPSRPGQRKSRTSTTPKSSNVVETISVTPPTIHKGWPSRATTEFTGWPTPSTTPISIEQILRTAKTVSFSPIETEILTTEYITSTTTTTTTTMKPTTPGICENDCDLASTIKLVSGAKWVPELLDRNTKEWQLLSNEVQTLLDDTYSKSKVLKHWFKSVRIDGFSEGSVLVDYVIELSDVAKQTNTAEIKKMFHETLTENASGRNPKSLNTTNGGLSLGKFVLDPKYTDFIVIPKQVYPTGGYNEEKVILPQWAIAVLVIGLASLLFVVIFGVTVLVNREKNAKKKTGLPLSQDMLDELNKDHMGGEYENYGAESIYDMEWNEQLQKQEIPGPIHGRKAFDSWKSEWNGYYFNAYHGGNSGSHPYDRKFAQSDTNF